MEICVESFDGETYTVEVGVDDTTADIRRKVAFAAELCEDGFEIRFGGKVMAEGDDTTQLSAGDTVVLTKTLSQKDDAIAALRDVGETRLTTERFKGLEDPKLIHLFLQAEVVTEIPNRFLQRSTFEELDLSGVSSVTAIGVRFLAQCRSLHTVDLSGWSNVTHVESYFLGDCSALRTLNLSGWSNVTHISDYVFRASEMSALTSVDLSGWSNVTHIGAFFMENCFKLKKLDFSGWNNVTHVKAYFLCDCSALSTVNLSDWTNVTQIDCYFLTRCSALTTLDLSGWSSMTHIEEGFLAKCTALTTVDLSGWDRLTQIKQGCLSGCIALRRLDLSGWRNVTEIGPGFLYGCNIRTRSINMTGSSSVVYFRVHDMMDDTKCQCVCT